MLLMAEILHQLSLVVEIPVFIVFYIHLRWCRISSIISGVITMFSKRPLFRIRLWDLFQMAMDMAETNGGWLALTTCDRPGMIQEK